MTTNVIDTARGEGLFATRGGGERALLYLLGTRNARAIEARAREDAAIDAEDILTQAEEANALDPVG